MIVKFQWREGEEAWQGTEVPSAGETSLPSNQPTRPARQRRRRALASLLILATLVAATLFGVRTLAQHRLQAAYTDLQAIVAAEATAIASGDAELVSSLQAPSEGNGMWALETQTPTETRVRITDLELRGDRAWVWVGYERDGTPYERLQFYRLVSGKYWRRTTPDQRFWGESEVWETGHFRFLYHAREEEIISQMAQWAETIYTHLDFGPGDVPTRITIEIGPEGETDLALPERRFALPSPLLTGIRTDGQMHAPATASGQPIEGTISYLSERLMLNRSTLWTLAYNVAMIRVADAAGPCGSPVAGELNWLFSVAAVHYQLETLWPELKQAGRERDILRDAVATASLLPLETLSASCYAHSERKIVSAHLLPDDILWSVCISPILRRGGLVEDGLWPPCPLRTQPDHDLALAQAKSLVAFAEERPLQQDRVSPRRFLPALLALLSSLYEWTSTETIRILYRREVTEAGSVPAVYAAAFGEHPDEFVAAWYAWLRARYR